MSNSPFSPIPPPSNLFATLFASLAQNPSKWTKSYYNQIVERGDKRIEVLNDRVSGITQGRVMPDLEQVTIGSGKRFTLAVLFLDICGFSSLPNWTEDEQKRVLSVMNIFMAEMLNVVRDFGGTYEKNTGDGLMAYFGDGLYPASEQVRPAAEAAVVMHAVNDLLLTPWFKSQGIKPVTFRVGIDLGPVTIARVGLRGAESSIVAIGTPANIACKLMNRIPNGGICIGDEVYKALPHNWAGTCRQSDQPTGFVYVKTNAPYVSWELNHRLTAPVA